MPERDMLSLGVMGMGGWTWPEILPPPSPSPPSGGGGAGGIRNTSYTGAILGTYRKRWNLQEEMEPTLRDGTYFKRLKFRDFIEKRQLWSFKKMGVVFWRKKRPCGNTARSTQLFLQKNVIYLHKNNIYYKK